jgi:anti-sigma-K factor RskA
MSEERDIDAAEYVLGTLPADERARLAEELKSDPALRAAVRAWQARLTPLDDTAAPELPSPGLWSAIERATFGRGSADAASDVVALRRKLAVWRSSAIVAGALAAALAVVAVIDRLAVPPTPEGGRYVAVVNSDGAAPALIAEVDTEAGVIRIRSLHAETPAGHSLELWHIAEGKPARSLGILKAGTDAQVIKDALGAGPVGGLIAVTVEPVGGSPTGVATGPVVYSGELVPLE